VLAFVLFFLDRATLRGVSGSGPRRRFPLVQRSDRVGQVNGEQCVGRSAAVVVHLMVLPKEVAQSVKHIIRPIVAARA
jgi:hypothetical protein